MAKSLSLDQVGAMFTAGPVKARQAGSSAYGPSSNATVVLRVTPCSLCAGDLYTVLPEDPEEIRVLRLVHAACVGF